MSNPGYRPSEDFVGPIRKGGMILRDWVLVAGLEEYSTAGEWLTHNDIKDGRMFIFGHAIELANRNWEEFIKWKTLRRLTK